MTQNNNKKKELTDEEKIKINEEILQSGGVLRDYDNNELLYPLNLPLIDTLEKMKSIAKSQL